MKLRERTATFVTNLLLFGCSAAGEFNGNTPVVNNGESARPAGGEQLK
jgi:hypothetical protein